MHDFVFSLMLLGALSSTGQTPFWAQSNNYGIMPAVNGGLGVMQAYVPFDESKSFQWRAGTSLAAGYSPVDPLNPESSPFHPMVDELYASLRWKVLRMDLGMRHRDREFLGADPLLGSLSASEGHIVESNNARTMPGINFSLEPLAVPFTGKHLLISGDWGDYTTIDDRYVQGALVHRLRAYLRFDTLKHFYIQLGLDHYGLWGGTPSDPRYAPIEINFENYLRICTGRSASASGSKSDQMNVLGDHGGAEQLRMGWRDERWDLTFQWEKPYSDKSGMRFNNIPDGIYTLHWSLKDKDRWITDALVEFHYTMWQSGTVHEKETDADGKQIVWYPGLNIFGRDNYFNNGEYKSGWTHFGRMIGAPTFYTAYGTNGIVSIVNNRYRAIHAGISGKLFRRAPYRMMLTLSDNYGTYGKPYISPSSSGSGWNWWEPNTIDKGLRQLSFAFNGYVPLRLSARHSLDIVYGLYADAGEVLQNNFGATAGIRYTFR